MPLVPGNNSGDIQETPNPVPTTAPTPAVPAMPEQQAQAPVSVEAQTNPSASKPVTISPSSPNDYVQSTLNDFNQAGKINIDESDTNKKSNIAIFSQNDQSPDDAARVYDLSVKMGLPADYIKDNMKEVQKESFNQDFSYDDYKARSPKFTDWLAKDQQNLPLVKDQVQHISDMEDGIKDYSLLQSAHDSMMSGFASFNRDMADFPALAYESTHLTQNIIASTFNIPEIERKGDFLRDSKVSKYYDDAAKFFANKNPDLKTPILKSIGEGNWEKAGRAIWAQAALNAPQILSMAVMNRFGLIKQSLALAGITTASNSATENSKNGNIPTPVATSNALAKGALEIAFEKTPDLLKGWTDGLLTGVGKQAKVEILKNFSKMFAQSIMQEGTEEALTSVTQDLTDYFSGVNPDALNGIWERMAESGIVGAATGAGPTTLSGVTLSLMQNQSRIKAENEKKLFLAIGDSVDKTNLKKKLPKKYQELANEITKDGPVESFYMDVGSFDKHFESYDQGGVPGAIKALGIENEYNNAKETGGRIKIPTANWASSMDLATYAKTADDITFSHDGITTNENKMLAETFFQEMQNNPEDVTAKQIEENLIKAGRSPEEAKALGALWGDRIIKRFSEKTGVAPETILGPEGDRQLNIEGQPVQDNAPLSPSDVVKQGKYNPEVLDSILTDLETTGKGGASTHNPQTGETIPGFNEGGPAYLTGTGYKIKDIKTAFKKQIEGKALTPYQEEIVSKLYKNSGYDKTVDIGPVTFFQDEKKAAEKDGFNTEKVYYHGTRSGKNFESFDPSESSTQPGVFFSEDSKHAAGFSTEYSPDGAKYAKGSRVIPVYLKTEKIFDPSSKSDQGKLAAYAKEKGFDDEFISELISKMSDSANGWRSSETPLVSDFLKNGDYQGQYLYENENKNIQVIDPSAIRSVYEQSKIKPKRGSIDIIRDQLGKSKIFNIKFLENADRSTFLHESAHAFLEIFADLAEHPDANQSIKDDWIKTLAYLGVKSRKDIKKRHHEKWAESFEKYLFEGKAPAPELNDMFNTFQSWLVSVYKTIEKIYPKLQLTDSIRGVFDRMIASEEELDRARAQSGANPQFMDTAGVMLPEEASKYQDLIAKEKEKQAQMVLQKAMHDQTQEYLKRKSTRRKEIKVQAEIDAAKEPEQIALKAIREGVMPDGQTLPPGMDNLKINKRDARNIYKDNVLETVPRGVFDNDGLHPNIVANILLGSESTGAELIAQLAATPEFNARVEEITEQRMAEEFPDPIADGTIAKEAVKAVHNDISLDRKQFEIDIMMKNHASTVKSTIKRLTARKISNAQFKARAEIIIGGMQVRDINPNQFKNAERKNSNLAIQLYLKGDLQGAIEAKQKEILNGELYKLAVKIDAEVNKNIDKFSEALRVKDDKLSKRYNVDTFNAARALLSYYGFGKSEKSPEEYLKYTKEYNVDIYNSVSQYLSKAMLTAKDYRDLTYNEFVDLSNSFFQIKEISKLENQITVQDRKMSKRDVIDNELIPQLKDVKGNNPDRIRVISPGTSPMEQISFYIGSFINALKRAEAWAVGMDNGKFDGPFRKYIFETVYNGVIKYRLAKNSVLGSFRDLLAKNNHLFTTDSILATELPSMDGNGQPHTFNSMHELLGAILHTGNLSNKRKLLVGNNWGSIDENGEFDDSAWEAFINRMIREGTLTKEHFDLVQSIWDLMEGTKKDAQAAHKELYGYNFEEITSNSFTNATGTYKGGYAPAITDKSRVKNIKEYNVEISDDAHNWFPANPNGFTKARNENYTKPLLMDLRLVPNHVDAVLRFSHISVPVKNVSMILEDRAFSDELDKYDPTAIKEFLKPWLERSLSQRSSKSTDNKAMDYFLSKMRSLQGAGVMFANVMNTMQQYTGVLVATAKVDAKYLRNSTFDVIKNGKDVASFAVEMSDFMKTKISFTNDHIVSDVQNIIDPPSGLEKVDEWFKRNAYVIQGIAQGHVDLIVWNGAYHQAIDQGATPKVATQMADSAVRLTQGTFAAEDVSSIEAGNPLLKIFTMFYSYYNTIANLYGTELKVAMNQDLGLRKTASRLFFLYAVSFALPAILSQAMVMAMSGQPFDENDDDEYITDALKVFFMPQLRTIAGTVPGLGPIFNAAIAKFDKNAFNDRISLSPIFQTIEKFKDQPFNMVEAYQKGKINKKKVQDALSIMNMTSLIPGVPFVPFQALSRPVGYLMDVNTGRARPKDPIDVVQGLMSGRAK